ncbi:MAG: HAD-IA family hydrolase [Clostridiales bacterium]|nr:HAD-IA family hydrolase [Clostridiales bacterium]
MAAPIRGIAFDLDGTLMNSLEDLAASVNEVLSAHGLPAHPLDAYHQMVGDGMRVLIERALGGRQTPELTGRLLPELMKVYDRDCVRLSRPYDGMPEAVAALKAAGVRLAVITNKPEPQAEKIVNHFYSGLFDGIYGLSGERRAKPDPALTLTALDELGVPAAEALFVGDSNVDIRTARAAGLRSVGVLWGFRSREELEEAGADRLISQPGELTELVQCGW